MDTSQFDSAAKQHLNIYRGFMSLVKWTVVLVALTLILMALFLL